MKLHFHRLESRLSTRGIAKIINPRLPQYPGNSGNSRMSTNQLSRCNNQETVSERTSRCHSSFSTSDRNDVHGQHAPFSHGQRQTNKEGGTHMCSERTTHVLFTTHVRKYCKRKQPFISEKWKGFAGTCIGYVCLPTDATVQQDGTNNDNPNAWAELNAKLIEMIKAKCASRTEQREEFHRCTATHRSIMCLCICATRGWHITLPPDTRSR